MQCNGGLVVSKSKKEHSMVERFYNLLLVTIILTSLFLFLPIRDSAQGMTDLVNITVFFVTAFALLLSSYFGIKPLVAVATLSIVFLVFLASGDFFYSQKNLLLSFVSFILITLVLIIKKRQL